MKLICEPIQNKDRVGGYENVLIRDKNGFAWAILFIDVFYDQNNDEMYEKIKSGQDFEIEISLAE